MLKTYHKNIIYHSYLEMDFWLIAYMLISVVVGGFAVSTLYKRGQTIGAMISLVLLILIFIFYGLRWFSGGKLKGTTNGKIAWPPIVNMCPDFMVSWKDSTNGNIYCYDAGDVYGLKADGSTANVQGITRGLTINGKSGQSAFLIKGPSASSTTLKSNLDIILRDTKANQIRWEGVWDGQTSKSANAPTPA
jgi:hypothetical protein